MAAGGGATAGASVSARLLVVMMAGKSTDSQAVTSSADALKQIGIKILCLGIGGSFDEKQMKAMASSSDYFRSVSSFEELSGFSQQFISLISTGKDRS